MDAAKKAKSPRAGEPMKRSPNIIRKKLKALGYPKIIQVEKDWTPGFLLSQTGLFFLEDIAPILFLDVARLKSSSSKLKSRGKDRLEVLGVCYFNRRWLIDMVTFSANFLSVPRQINPRWDSNQLLAQVGIFYLDDVCGKIPYSKTQLQAQARNSSNSRKEVGIWKDQKKRVYFVDMAIFGPWISKIWREGASNG